MATALEWNLSSSNPVGGTFDGGSLRSQFQIIRTPASGDYKVVVEGGIVEANGDVTYGTVGTYDQREDRHVQMAAFGFHSGLRYRFRHVAGVAVKVLVV